MRLLPSDPDIRTIFSRIVSEDIDLQPDFQRGEVWSEAKKQRLIDSILREWHVPPIHVIEVAETAKQEVLDGQQRLVSIRDFVNNLVSVDGKLEPHDPAIAALHGLRYHQLPEQWRRKFDQFTIRVFRIIDYRPGEPGELFYRLNQPTNLTAAEQRNAFFGPARQQVKDLVNHLESLGADKDFVGFSNSRMAYDDVIARLCVSIEIGTLREKVTAAVLANRYRSEDSFAGTTFEAANGAIELFASSRKHVSSPARFNKATLYSWLYFLVNAAATNILTPALTGHFIGYFEARRTRQELGRPSNDWASASSRVPSPLLQEALAVYNDRAAARVNDTSSVLARDIALWCAFLSFIQDRKISVPQDVEQFQSILNAVETAAHDDSEVGGEEFISRLIQDYHWETVS